jgi:hypothetical protein
VDPKFPLDTILGMIALRGKKKIRSQEPKAVVVKMPPLARV